MHCMRPFWPTLSPAKGCTGHARVCHRGPATALQLVQEAPAQVVRIGDRHREAALRNTLADLFHAGRETKQAMGQLKPAVVIFSEIGSKAGGENAEIWMLREW